MNRAADDLISRKQAIKEILAFCPEETKPGSLDEYGVAVLSGIIEVVLIATMSVKVISSIQPCTVTTSFWISESIAYPPPMVNMPIMKKVRNNSMYIISCPPFSFSQHNTTQTGL